MSERSRGEMVAQGVLIAARDAIEDLPFVGTFLRIAADEFEAVAKERMRQMVKITRTRLGVVEERLEELVKQPEKAELLFRGIRLSIDARTADKIEALASAVARGLEGDATGLALAYMTLDAIGSLDAPQIRILRVVGTAPDNSFQVGGFSAITIRSRVPDFDGDLIDPTIALLEGKGLIARTDPAGTLGLTKEILYRVTALGEAVNELLTTPRNE